MADVSMENYVKKKNHWLLREFGNNIVPTEKTTSSIPSETVTHLKGSISQTYIWLLIFRKKYYLFIILRYSVFIWLIIKRILWLIILIHFNEIKRHPIINKKYSNELINMHKFSKQTMHKFSKQNVCQTGRFDRVLYQLPHTSCLDIISVNRWHCIHFTYTHFIVFRVP